MKTYLITVKRGDIKIAQKILNSHDTLNLVRKTFASVYEETSADIKAISLLADIEKGDKAKVIEYNGSKMVVQLHEKEA